MGDSTTPGCDYDEVLSERVGAFGRWQLLVFLLLTPIIASNACVNVAQTFAFYESSFRCRIEECEVDGEYDAGFAAFAVPFWTTDEEDLSEDDLRTRSCTNYCYVTANETIDEGECSQENFAQDLEICESHIYDQSEFENSLVAELDFGTCGDYDEDWPLYPVVTRVSLLGTATAIGNFAGAFSLGIISDRYGRKLVIMGSTFLAFVFLLVAAFCPNYWAMFAIRFVQGLVVQGMFNLSVPLLVEIVGTAFRVPVGILVNVPYAVGQMVAALLAFLFQSWDDYFLSLSLLTLPCMLLWFVLPESPRWLLTKGRAEEAAKVLRKGAKINGKSPDHDHLQGSSLVLQETPEESNLSAKFLFSGWTVSRITLVLWVNWVAVSMCYYGLAYVSVSLSEDIYLSFVLSSLVEIPSYIAAAVVLDGFGRKTVMIVSQLLGGVCCVAAALVDLDWLVTTLSLIGKFGASSAFAVVILYTAELYPTGLRATAVGFSATMGRLGAIAAPVLAAVRPVSLPLAIMGASALLGGALVLLLPETLAQPFPESIQDVEALYKHSKPWYKWMTRAELKTRQEQLQKLKQPKKSF